MNTTDTTDETREHDSTATEAGPASMRAIVQRAYGSADDLALENVDLPKIAADEVLIEVHAAGVDRGVWHLMTGNPYLIRIAGYGLTKPKQPIQGLDVAGRVVAVGADVTRLSPGDEVFGIANGSFADYAAAKEHKMALKPANLSFEQAAVSAVSGITALQALTDVGGVEAGQRVLVIGASGGVGTFAVQLAEVLGAKVDGVAGTRNLELVRSLGADRVFDHRHTDLADISERYDLILDIGGRNPVRKLRSLLTKSGTLVIVGGEGGNRITGGIGRQLRAVLVSPFVSQRLTMFVSTEHHSIIEQLSEFLGNGAVVPTVRERFTLDQAADALRQFETGEASAKSVIVVRGSGADRDR